MRRKSIFISVAVIFLLILIGFITHLPSIFQEGNLITVSKSIIKLKMSDKKIVPIDSQRYITEIKGNKDTIILFMKDKGWTFKEQYGAGFVFEKQGNTLTVVCRQYIRYFMVDNTPKW